MKRRIYLSLLAIGMACMAITIVICSWVFWKSTQEQAAAELNSGVAIISTGMSRDPDPEAYLQRTAESEQGALRITWINTDGTVKFESDYDAAKMENHLQRPEVQEAFANGSGSAVRDSATIDKALYYAAKKLPDGTVLRISLQRRTILAHFISLLPIALLLFFLAGLGCIKASRSLTSSLLEPLRRTAHMMENIGTPARDLPQEMPHVYRELRPLVQKIVDQSNYINHTIQTLERERNTVRITLENLQEGVILTDKAGKIIVLNSCAKNILEVRTHMDVSGLSLEKLLPHVDWPAIWNAEQEPFSSEQRLTRNDRLYELIVQPIYKDSQLYGALFILYDVTERERREQLRREFTSNVSHELKTPLTSISGFAEMLAAGLYEKDEDAHHFGTLIRQEAQRLLTLIEGIIHLTKIEESPDEMEMTDVSLAAVVAEIVSFMDPVLQKKEVTVHQDMEDIQVRGNKDLLRELCMNLIDNAVKYNLPGGHVYVSLHTVGRRAALVVRDTGIGIPADKQQRVFERFYRVDRSRKKNGGSGLGLSIVKHIAEQHHGQLQMESKEGEETKITVYLPLV